jgi:membrane associated rhomboid family serine protease
VAEVDLNVVCKNCGSEVSPYITECPYCGQRLRKRAPKLSRLDESGTVELAPAPRRRRFRRARTKQAERPLAWLSAQRPYVTVALLVASAAVYLAYQANAGDTGILAGPIGGDWWRLVTSQFNYDNVGYLFAVGVAVGIFGTSLERRYSGFATAAIFLGCGALGMYLATVADSNVLAIGGNGSALGLMGAWFIRDLRDRRAGFDTESDLLGAAAIAAVMVAMPLLARSANGWVGLGGGALGCLVGAVLPSRR